MWNYEVMSCLGLNFNYYQFLAATFLTHVLEDSLWKSCSMAFLVKLQFRCRENSRGNMTEVFSLVTWVSSSVYFHSSRTIDFIYQI